MEPIAAPNTDTQTRLSVSSGIPVRIDLGAAGGGAASKAPGSLAQVINAIAGLFKALADAIVRTASTRPDIVLMWLGAGLVVVNMAVGGLMWVASELAPLESPALLAGSVVGFMFAGCGSVIALFRAPRDAGIPARDDRARHPFLAHLDVAAQHLISVNYQKRNLEIMLEFKKVNDDGTALLHLCSRYQVTNLGSSSLQYSFKAQFDVSRRARTERPWARLAVRQHGRSTTNDDLSEFKPEEDTWLYEEWFTLLPSETFDFEWECEYVVDLPFTEFWATGHPTENFTLGVDPGASMLEVSLDVYRDQKLGKTRRVEGDVKRLECDGLFLPYNGIHVSVRPLAENQPEVHS